MRFQCDCLETVNHSTHNMEREKSIKVERNSRSNSNWSVTSLILLSQLAELQYTTGKLSNLDVAGA